MKYLLYLVLAGLIVLSVLLFESEREKNIIKTNAIVIESSKIEKDKKIVFISDLHDKIFGDGNKELFDLIENENPDFILIGGDIVVTKNKKCDLKPLDTFLCELVKIAPVYYANGNHEQRFFYEENKDTYGKYKDEFLNILNKNNVHYLDDSFVDIDEIRIYGLSLYKECYQDFTYKRITEKDIENKIGKTDKDKFNILLAHSPMYLDKYEKWGADLGLSGHFHGGVMRLGKQGVLSSQWQLFHKWCVGQFKINDTDFVVSAGLGGHTIDVRINNYPELNIIELKHK